MEPHIILIEIRPPTPTDRRIIVIPETIEVKQYSRVKWLIKDSPAFHQLVTNSINYGLNFTIYFDNKSPFSWRRETLRIYGNPVPPPPPLGDKYDLAEGLAEEKGDFKYGVRISEVGTDESIYDEDPYIRVF